MTNEVLPIKQLTASDIQREIASIANQLTILVTLCKSPYEPQKLAECELWGLARILEHIEIDLCQAMDMLDDLKEAPDIESSHKDSAGGPKRGKS